MQFDASFFARERTRMVEVQLKRRGITDTAVLEAMNTVPRELFVLPAYQDIAYDDTPLPIPDGQTISQPFIVAYMIAALQLKSTDLVFEVGTGSGYEAAVLSRMVREVITVERHERLVQYARQRLAQLSYLNVQVYQGDGSLGWPDQAPYNAIIVSAGGPFVPPSLSMQLAVNGRLVMPVGPHTHQQVLVRYTKDSNDALIGEELGPVAFVPLIGVEGWQDENCRYEALDEAAGNGIRVHASSLTALFTCAAEAMFNYCGAMVDENASIKPRFVAVESDDAKSLLIAWLNELLYQHETRGEIYKHVRITSWKPTRLEAIIHGCLPAEPPIVFIKSVTYHQLQLSEEEGSWKAEIYFDN